jgi:site-specific DNA recombinase
MKRVGIYLRVSTEEQARIQDGSLVSQRQRAIEYVEAQNRKEGAWGTIADFYCDEGRSAKDMRRPEFQRLLNDVRSGRINLILSTELSRLSRSIRDFCELWDLFKRHNASFVTLREQIDTTTAAGEMMVFNLINFAQFERKQTAESIAANWQSRAKRGLWNGGTIPFGFTRNDKNPGELRQHETEAGQVKEIFETFLRVGSVRQTCLELSRSGIFSKCYINKHGAEKAGSTSRFHRFRAFLRIAHISGFGKSAFQRDVSLNL